ncbi:TonB-dependent hemoglobin/transferrin/lactoferrin family receptor [Zavarzinia compransoris]|nr:TonB-dependent hemoglobin/transferrin/lactoferrin family receptor [Zavarzinia compransoris]TDP46167.1 hemoglobin/transferrin/lactoferrin receptor protein [Zavarzinia compransoris]
MGMIRQSLLRGVAFGALAAGTFGLPALAQEAAPIQLDQVTVEGEADPKPVKAETTDRETLEERQVENFEDFSRRVDAGVNVDRGTRSINIRGLGEDRVLTTIDGIRLPWLNDPVRSYRGGLSSVSFDSLSTIDIFKGADSSTLGSGALGGAVVLRTLQPEDLLAGDKNFGGLLKETYTSDDESWRTTAAVAARLGDTLVLAQGGYRFGHELENQGNVDVLGATRTVADPSDREEGNGLITIHHYLAEGHRLGFTGEYYNDENEIDTLSAQGTTATFAAGANTVTEINNRKRASVDYTFSAPSADSLVQQARVILYWQDTTRENNQDARRRTPAVAGQSGLFVREYKTEEETYGANGDATLAFTAGGLGHRLTLGADFAATRSEQFAGGADDCTRTGVTTGTCASLKVNQADIPEAEGRDFAAFVQDDISLLDGTLTVTPGLRFDWFEREPQDSAAFRNNAGSAVTGLPASSDGSRVSPKLLLTWTPDKDVSLYAQWAQAYRAPSVGELYTVFRGSAGPSAYMVVGNPDLKPETSNSYEVGAKLGDDKLGGRIAFFNSYYRNFIEAVNLTPAPAGYLFYQQNQNLSRVQIYGVELSTQWAFAEGWRSWGSLSVATGKNTETDAYLNSVPPLRALVGLGYSADSWGADAVVNAAATRDDTALASDVRVPSYTTLDLTAYWEPSFVPGVRIDGGIFNVFDTTYWNALNVPDATSATAAPAQATIDRVSEPGRNFRVSATYRF